MSEFSSSIPRPPEGPILAARYGLGSRQSTGGFSIVVVPGIDGAPVGAALDPHGSREAAGSAGQDALDPRPGSRGGRAPTTALGGHGHRFHLERAVGWKLTP